MLFGLFPHSYEITNIWELN